MKGMIFAAGIGSRLKPWTLEHPKALVPVGGMPMLQRVILKFKDAGINEIVINVHHFASQIADFLKANGNFGLHISLSDESQLLLDTGGGLLKASSFFHGDEPVLIHNADIHTDFDIIEMATAFKDSGADALLLADHRDSTRCLYFDSHGLMRGWGNRLTGLTRPDCLDTRLLDAMSFGGVHIINPATILPVLADYATDDIFSITDFYIATCHTLAIKRYTPSCPYNWIDVGRPHSLALARRLLD